MNLSREQILILGFILGFLFDLVLDAIIRSSETPGAKTRPVVVVSEDDSEQYDED